ncbi:MAG: DUF2027 domain-containing protein [Prevotellaceae bacterium]|jgi:dsDNA-specific endonuclease/ATPase MutS2|nr:DUF2027 domain-containing protein [Prevotellaceae bacterium]
MVKTGDNVRFLNDVGGGIVTKIDKKKGLVYVEGADGFEIPVLEREVVVVPKVNKKNNIPLKIFGIKASDNKASDNKATTVPVQTVEPVADVKKEIYETADGDHLNVLLAFLPVNIKKLLTTSYDCLLINDSNYFVFYNVITGEEDGRKSLANGLIEPNTQELLKEITKEELNDWAKTRIQAIAFKKGKAYVPQNTLDVTLKLDMVKFYKLHSFAENDYFDVPSMVIGLHEAKERQQDEATEKQLLKQISTKEIKEAISQKETSKKRQAIRLVKNSSTINGNIIEVDLHINALLDTTAGMTGADMLQYQVDKFRAVLSENKKNTGQKIIFIHGKGEGVLRHEIEKLLKTDYKSYYFQDASFREYGFGATMVIIH